MKKWIKGSIAILAVMLLLVSQNNWQVFALTSENTTVETTENNEGSSVEEESSEAAAMAQQGVASPFSVGLASFDGTDLSGNTDVSYDVRDATNQPRTLDVLASFDGSGTTTNRKITIRIENGLRFHSIPGMVMSNNYRTWIFDANALPTQLQGIITNGTFTLDPMVYEYGVKSGTLVLDVAPGATNVSLSIQTAFDLAFGANDGSRTFTDMLTVTTSANVGGTETIIDEEVLENYTITGTIQMQFYSVGGSSGIITQYIDAGDSVSTEYYLSTAGSSYTNSFAANVLLKKQVLVFEIDKALGVQSVTSSDGRLNSSQLSYAIDSTSSSTKDILTITFSEIRIDGQKVKINFASSATATPGTYAINGVSGGAIAFGTDKVMNNGYVHKQNIIITEPFENKLAIDGVNGNIYINPDLTNEELQPLGIYSLANNFAKNVDDQMIRLTFNDPTIGVRMVRLVTGYGMPATNVVVHTEKGKTITIPSITSTGINTNTSYATFNLSSYGDVDADDYIVNITYESTGFLSGSGRGAGNSTIVYERWDLSPGLFSGVIRDVPATKKYNAIIEVVPSAVGDFSASDAQNKVLTMSMITTGGAISFYSGNTLSTQPYLAGNTIPVHGSFTLSSEVAGTMMLKRGFDIYLREDKYFQIDTSSIKIVWEGITYSTADGSLIPIAGTDNQGLKTWKINVDDIAIGKFKPNGSAYSNMEITYEMKVANSAPTVAVNAADLLMVVPTNDVKVTSNGNTAYFNNANKFNVDGSGNLTKSVGTLSKDTYINIQAQKDFTVTTAANLNDGSWVSYDYASNQSIIDLNPSGDAKYQLTVANNSGSTINGYTALIPIPKYGEKTDLTPSTPANFDASVDLQKEAFSWTASLLAEIVPAGTLNYQVLYATTYETDKDSANFVSWSAITDPNEIRMVKIVTNDAVADGFSEALSFPLALTDTDADLHAGNTNIYSARIYREILGTAGYKPSEPIAIRLKTGVVKGNVFNDLNRNGVKDGTETGRNGITVIAYAAGTTTVIETTTTKTIDGVDGQYEFLGLDKNQNVDIVFINPTTNDSTRFSPVTSGGSTPSPAVDNSKATTAGIAPSATGFDTVYAGIITPVTITLNPGIGTSANATVQKYPGEQIVAEPAATATGYTFNGWFTTSTGGSKVAFPYTVGTLDTTLYAQYTANKYVLSYDIATNGGQGTAPANEQVTYNTLATLPAVPVKTGYTFVGWFDAASGGTQWNFSTNKMPANDVKLYAQFTINNYMVTFNNDSATSTLSVTYDQLVTEPTAPSKTGYTFTGWFDATSGGTEWDFAVDKMPANDITLYAQYSINSYVLTYNDQGTETTTTVEYDALIIEPTTIPVKSGYTFTGWFDAATGGTKWLFNSHKMPAANKTLYAQFSADNQTITFDVNGGLMTSRPANIVQPTDSSIDLDAVAIPTRAGYSFVGWFDSGDVQHSGTITMPVGGLALQAKWTADDQVISFNSKGGSGVASITAKTDTTVDLDQAITSKPGYQFDGWFVADTQYSGITTVPAGGLTLEAHWTALDQTITFDVNGGDISSQPADLIQPTDSTVDINALVTPTWFGHKFLGWYDGDTHVFGTITMPAGGLQLVAQWQDLVATGVWNISANNLEIKLSEVNNHIQAGTLKDEILSRSNAQAWETENGTLLTPLTLGLSTLLDNPAVGDYNATVAYEDPNSPTTMPQTFAANSELLAQEATTSTTLQTTFVVTVVDDTSTLPTTGDDSLLYGVLIGTSSLAIGGVFIFLVGKRKSEEEA
ncbi:InlB B-repeat-containing protein [Culicoidibacter larvae]|uniref:LPXTG cell wall anchor domain-containing protein n=1 Tax=Culicoidibacter larvae TaxID=2579976 RepID=A0A5R8Q9T8_9FIRM|nr:InlB B-repeat-containing protein [Culicoidibacter larvae]TLG72686.1 LPXTG cell wall anchor domain-containing protein [Culicoidibacter larvae]